MVNLVREWRAGRLQLFAPPRKPGPPPGVAPAKDRARGRVIQQRRQGLSTYEISARLAAEGTPLNRTSVGEILAEEGFGRLLRARPARQPKAAPRPPPAATPTCPGPPCWTWALGRGGWTPPGPGCCWCSRTWPPWTCPPWSTPKKSALTSYSYRTSHDHQRSFLAALDAQMISSGLAASEQAIFDLDFHAVMHWGHDPALERHYLPQRSQRTRSVLTFAQDSGTHNLVDANADLHKATQAREVLAFCHHWKAVSGADPRMLVMDQKLTTQQVLGELDARGVKFLTLRMRSPALVRYINGLTPADFKTLTLDRPGRFSRPKVHQSTAEHLTSYPGTVRQLIVTGLGHHAPTVIITNDHHSTTKAIIERYARRMTIEQRLAEIIRAFHTDALSSTVNLNVDLDVMLAVLAQALLAALRARLPGYATATPDTLQRRFLETPGTIITTDQVITVRLQRRAYAPVLRQADLPPTTTVPWWGNRTLRYEFS